MSNILTAGFSHVEEGFDVIQEAIGISAAYVHNQDLRLRLYRRIASMREEREIDPLAEEFADRFGPLPEMVQNLFYQMRVKLRAEKLGLSAVSWEGGQVALRFPVPAEGSEPKRLSDFTPGVRGGKSAYWVTFAKDESWTAKLLDVLGQLKDG